MVSTLQWEPKPKPFLHRPNLGNFYSCGCYIGPCTQRRHCIEQHTLLETRKEAIRLTFQIFHGKARDHGERRQHTDGKLQPTDSLSQTPFHHDIHDICSKLPTNTDTPLERHGQACALSRWCYSMQSAILFSNRLISSAQYIPASRRIIISSIRPRSYICSAHPPRQPYRRRCSCGRRGQGRAPSRLGCDSVVSVGRRRVLETGNIYACGVPKYMFLSGPVNPLATQ